MNEPSQKEHLQRVLELLETHYQSFMSAVDIARSTCHPVPVDSRAWSQILVSVLTGINGLARQKGADLADGSDVKAANTWEAIDTPRFNGVIKAGTKARASGKIASLDATPHLFFVLWDTRVATERPRCRIWCVQPPSDPLFRAMCAKWFKQRDDGKIVSNNFQLHPPRRLDTNVIRNTCGNLLYPLYFAAERTNGGWTVTAYDPSVLKTGKCQPYKPMRAMIL
jgi:hypothetical protein